MSLSIFTNSDLPRWVQVVTRHIAELGIVFRTSFLNTINNLTSRICSDAWAPAMTLYQGKLSERHSVQIDLTFPFTLALLIIFNAYSLLVFLSRNQDEKSISMHSPCQDCFFQCLFQQLYNFTDFFYRFELFPCICCKKMTLHYIFGCDVEYK